VVRAVGGQGAFLALVSPSSPGELEPIRGPTPGDLPWRRGETTAPLWSPEGDRLIFFDTEARLWAVTLQAGSAPVQLDEAPTSWAEWSPDGRLLAWSAESMHAATVEGVMVNDEITGRAGRASWSPDATKLFIGADSDGDTLTIWTLADGETRWIYREDGAWSPDARWFA
jgi:Tol biopolymer transport system component